MHGYFLSQRPVEPLLCNLGCVFPCDLFTLYKFLHFSLVRGKSSIGWRMKSARNHFLYCLKKRFAPLRINTSTPRDFIIFSCLHPQLRCLPPPRGRKLFVKDSRLAVLHDVIFSGQRIPLNVFINLASFANKKLIGMCAVDGFQPSKQRSRSRSL